MAYVALSARRSVGRGRSGRRRLPRDAPADRSRAGGTLQPDVHATLHERVRRSEADRRNAPGTTTFGISQAPLARTLPILAAIHPRFAHYTLSRCLWPAAGAACPAGHGLAGGAIGTVRAPDRPRSAHDPGGTDRSQRRQHAGFQQSVRQHSSRTRSPHTAPARRARRDGRCWGIRRGAADLRLAERADGNRAAYDPYRTRPLAGSRIPAACAARRCRAWL